MRMGTWIAIGALAITCSSAMAEGVPSREKLARLGLSNLKVASDEAGHQVKGKAFGAFSITFTLTAMDASVPPNVSTVMGTQSFVFGQDPQPLNAVSFGGTGFGGFNNPANPDFSTFTSTPLTTDTSVTGNAFVASIQGFMFSFGR